ncbi:MAG: lipopolysaccharide transport periplasmic protein LptA [Betaproteobacteria bacterium]|nr:lipopolysaccharide transport periplasmic protein LptA [Betaproteobacteria bacterium]
MRQTFTFFILALFLSFSAHAEKADKDKPTHIEADQMVADDVKQVTVFTGNVVMIQGTRIAKADKVVLVQDPAGYQFSTLYAAPGKLASLREKRDGGPDLWVEGYGERIEYDNKTEIIQFFTRANLKRLEGKTVTDDIRGEFISYDRKSEFYRVHNTSEGKSAPGAGRVKAIIQPRDK